MKPMIDSIEKLRRHIFDVFSRDWKVMIFWCTLLVPLVIVYFFIWYMSTGTLEFRFKLSGLLLELFGIVTVILELNRTHLSMFLKWIKEHPKWNKNHSITGSTTINVKSSSKTDYHQASPPQNTSTDDQVADLWKRLEQTNKQVFQAQQQLQQIQQENKNGAEALKNERRERETSFENLKENLKESANKRLWISLMAGVWLFFGAISATLSEELACLFDSFPVLLMALNTQ